MTRVSLGELSEIIQAGPFGTQLKKSEYISNGIPMLNAKNIGNGVVDTYSMDCVSKKVCERLPQYILHEGDILFGRSGTIDRHTLIDNEFDGAFQGTNVIMVRLKDERLAKYISYYLNLDVVKLKISLSAGKTTQQYITTDNLAEVIIEVPSEELALTISDTLSVIDRKIGINNAINAELERLAKTIYEYWFVQFDFPNAEGKPYKSSGGEMVYNETLKREIPDGWDAILFSKIIKENKEMVGIDFDRDTAYSIDLSVMPSGTMCLNGRGKASDFDANKFVLRKFDLLFGAIRPYLKKSGFSAFDGALNSSVLSFRPIKHDDFSFALCTLTSELMLQYAVTISSGQGTRMPTIGAKGILDFPIAYNSDLAKVFDNNVSTYWQQIASNINQNFELAALRDFLLPLLMNGQVTVDEAKADVAKVISSKPSAVTDDSKYQAWKATVGLAARGNINEQSLRKIYEALDADDR